MAHRLWAIVYGTLVLRIGHTRASDTISVVEIEFFLSCFLLVNTWPGSHQKFFISYKHFLRSKIPSACNWLRLWKGVTGMLVTDVGDEMCWWQLSDEDDGFGHFSHKNHFSLNSSAKNQHSKDVTEILSTAVNYRHQLSVTNITMSPRSLSQWKDLLSFTVLRCWWQN